MVGLKLYLIIGSVILIAAFGIFKYHSYLQTTIETLRENNVMLEIGIATANETLESIQRDNKTIMLINKQVSAEFVEIKRRTVDLENRLTKHDIGVLGVKKAKLVERIVNRGTANSNRCFEILSGSLLTKGEQDATKKSQTNTMCPRIANPNFNPD